MPGVVPSDPRGRAGEPTRLSPGQRPATTAHLNLREARLRRGWTQQELADRLGTALQTISRWERGACNPGPYMRARLCALFETSADLLGLVPDATSWRADEGLVDPMLPLTPALASTGLVGRSAELEQLRRLLTGGAESARTIRGATMPPAASLQVALIGLPGIGKTALAATITQDARVRGEFRDGVLWAGMGRTPDLLGVLHRWGQLLELDVTAMASLPTLDAWALALHAAIGTRRMLLVLDDVWRIEDALALRIGGPGCVHLLTTRSHTVAQQWTTGTAIVPVRELSDEDATRLVARVAPEALVSASEDAVRDVVRAVGGLPLALALIGAYLRREAASGQPRRLYQALERLREPAQRFVLSQPLAALDRPPGLPAGAQLSLESAISLTTEQLDHQAQAALRALAILPSKPATFTEAAALAVAGCSPPVLDRLGDAGLLESCGQGRYAMHQTIAEYAGLQARASGDDAAPPERLIHYVLALVAQPATRYEAIDREASAVAAALHLPFPKRHGPALVRIVCALVPYWHIRGDYAVAAQALDMARGIIADAGLSPLYLTLVRYAADNAYLRGAYRDAESFCDEGLRLAEQGNWPELRVALLVRLGEVYQRQGQYARAQTAFQEALTLSRQQPCDTDTAAICAGLGRIAYHQGDYAQSEASYHEGLRRALSRHQHEQLGEMLIGLGVVASARGEDGRAEVYFRRALAIARAIGHAQQINTVLLNLGAIARQRGKYPQARSYLQEGLARARAMGDGEQIAMLLSQIGDLATQQGDETEAMACLQEGLALAQRLALQEQEAGLLYKLGLLASRQGDYQHAEAWYQQGLILARQMGHQDGVAILLARLGDLAVRHAQLALAEQYLRDGLARARSIDNPRLIALLLCGWGEYALAARRADDAIDAYGEVLRRCPPHQQELRAEALFGLAQAAALQGNLAEAHHQAEQCLTSFIAIGHHRVQEVRAWLERLPMASTQQDEGDDVTYGDQRRLSAEAGATLNSTPAEHKP